MFVIGQVYTVIRGLVAFSNLPGRFDELCARFFSLSISLTPHSLNLKEDCLSSSIRAKFLEMSFVNNWSNQTKKIILTNIMVKKKKIKSPLGR